MSESRFHKAWKKQEPLIKLLVQMFDPFLEIAVHDLETETLAGIYHNFSRRQVGEPSPLTELNITNSNLPDIFPPYYKSNWDGRPLKCGSITMRDPEGKPVGLICLNIDASMFTQFKQALNQFLKTDEAAKNPIDQYGQSCREQAVSIVQYFLATENLSIHTLKRFHKRKIVNILYQKGIFNFKNAAPFIAKYLKISRATVYNYLKEIES